MLIFMVINVAAYASLLKIDISEYIRFHHKKIITVSTLIDIIGITYSWQFTFMNLTMNVLHLFYKIEIEMLQRHYTWWWTYKIERNQSLLLILKIFNCIKEWNKYVELVSNCFQIFKYTYEQNSVSLYI